MIGGGFAGAYVARELGTRGATIVSKENFMLYTPLLPEAASGTLEPRHCVVPLREMCPHADLILGAVTSLDLEARTVAVETDDGTQTVTRSRSRHSPTRSTSAITSCSSSRRPTLRSTKRSGHGG